jgi:hypothetical protein
VYRESGGNEAAQPVAGMAVNTGDTTGPNVDATEPNVPTHPKRSYRYTTFVLLLAISVPAFQFYLLSLLLIRVKDISTETDASKDPMNLAFAIIFLALKVIAHIFQGLELMAMPLYYDPKEEVVHFWRPLLFVIGLIELGVSFMCVAVGVFTYRQQTMMDFSNAITQILVAFFVESVDEQAFEAFQAIMSPTLYQKTINSIKKRFGPKEVFSDEQEHRIKELANPEEPQGQPQETLEADPETLEAKPVEEPLKADTAAGQRG